jgi:3-oxoadipate enol-lactonase
MPKTTVNGINMYYEVQGKGKPLVLIQGFGGAHQGWFFQIPAFKKHFLVVTFDNRGIGETDRSKEPYTIRTMADDVIELMDHLDIDKAHILGMSLGGMVAQEIAITYPGRVRKLVLASTFTSRELSDSNPQLQKAFGVQEGLSDAGIQNIDFDRLMKFMTSSAFNRAIYRMLFTFLLRIRSRSINVKGYLEQINAVRGYNTANGLHLIQAPTLVITGSRDRLVEPHCSDLIASRIPNANLVKVDGGSHAFFIEMRDRFNEEVLAFLTNNGEDNE